MASVCPACDIRIAAVVLWQESENVLVVIVSIYNCMMFIPSFLKIFEPVQTLLEADAFT